MAEKALTETRQLAITKLSGEVKDLRREEGALAAIEKMLGPKGRWRREQLDAANKIAKEIIRREREIGRLIPAAFPRGNRTGGAGAGRGKGRYKSSETKNFCITLESCGIDPKNDSPRFRALAKLTDEELARAIDSVAERTVVSSYLVIKRFKEFKAENKPPKVKMGRKNMRMDIPDFSGLSPTAECFHTVDEVINILKPKMNNDTKREVADLLRQLADDLEKEIEEKKS